MKSIKEILAHTQCFTHGGNLGALYGILATHKISSHNALLAHADNTHKFTDPNKEYTQEDNFLFFESKADRGNLSYSELLDKNTSHVGFAFLAVKSADSLLAQVDLIGNSDGMLLGLQNKCPLEVSLDKTKILIPESYRLDVESFCHRLKSLGHNPPDILVFKPIEEIQELLKGSQKELCESLGLKSQKSDKVFLDSEVSVATKTSTVSTCLSEPLGSHVDATALNSAQCIVDHMKQRPTVANLQRDSMFLFLEKHSSPLWPEISKLSDKRPLILSIDKPEDLVFAINTLIEFHPDKENGKISSHALRPIKNRLTPTLCQCLDVAREKKLSLEDFKAIHASFDMWHVALNRQPQPPTTKEQIKTLLNNSQKQEILVWKQGMTDWVNAREIPEFSTPVVNNILALRQKSLGKKSTLTI